LARADENSRFKVAQDTVRAQVRMSNSFTTVRYMNLELDMPKRPRRRTKNQYQLPVNSSPFGEEGDEKVKHDMDAVVKSGT
jgi:hypothetical protein